MNIELIVNNKPIQAQKGETILTALTRNGIKIPTLCHMEEFTPTGSCRLCVVEIKDKLELVPSCSYPVNEPMTIFTHSSRVINARKTIVELLLSNHPDDCLYCEKNQHCELQDLAIELNIRERRFLGKKKAKTMDKSSPAIVKDDSKCILCGRCIRICDERVQASAIDFSGRGKNTKVDTVMSRGLNYSSCIACGQCILGCPSGALSVKPSITPVLDALNNPNTQVFVQLAPAVGYSLSEKLGFKQGKDISPYIINGLKSIGFNQVYNLAWAGDLFITETAKYITTQKLKPIIITSCPATINYIEQFFPEALKYVSPIKTPQQIMGAIIKNQIAKEKKINPNNIFTVSIGPCTAAKAEANRLDTMSNGMPDIDAVLTTSELIRLLKLSGIDLHNIDEGRYDPPFHVASSSGSLYHVPGGLSEGIYRHLNFMETKTTPTKLNLKETRNHKYEKNVSFSVGKTKYKVKIVSGIQNIKSEIKQVISGNANFDILDLSACLLGCMSGGGQPLNNNFEEQSRILIKYLYKNDDKSTVKTVNQNPFTMDFSERIHSNELSYLKKSLQYKFPKA
jgi:NADH-quinone oxidoreductase subunit G/NADP-reducing hydrogenase subunit HndD